MTPQKTPPKTTKLTHRNLSQKCTKMHQIWELRVTSRSATFPKMHQIWEVGVTSRSALMVAEGFVAAPHLRNHEASAKHTTCREVDGLKEEGSLLDDIHRLVRCGVI
jgi:hypothetical protein